MHDHVAVVHEHPGGVVEALDAARPLAVGRLAARARPRRRSCAPGGCSTRSTSTNASVIEMMSPTSSDDDVARPSCRRRRGRRRRLAGTRRTPGGAGQAARSTGMRHRTVSVEAPRRGSRARRRRARARRPGAPRPAARRRSGRRDVEAGDRRTCSTRHPAPGGSAWTSPGRSTTTTVARSRVSSSRRHVAHVRDRVGAEHEEQLASRRRPAPRACRR